MSRFTFRPRDYAWEFLLTLALALSFGYIAQQHSGLYPSIFADEQNYSRFARLMPLGEVSIPSYLYFWVFGATNACGDGFLACARYLNLLFFVAAAPFIYLGARTVAGKPLAALVTLLCVLAPVKSYTAYFMPESMYFFGFWVLSWLALTRRAVRWARYAAAAGALLGLMMLVKVHALFLLPALCLFMVYAAWRDQRQGPWLRIGAAMACIAAVAALAVKFAIAYAFAGSNGLHLLGSFYGNQASGSLSAGATLLKLLPAALVSLRGHLMMLALLFGVPLAALLYLLLSPRARGEAGEHGVTLAVYTILMLGAALGLTVFYTASIADFGPREGVRLHVRYYDFTFPLLVMAAAVGGGAITSVSRRVLPWLIAAALAASLYHAQSVLPADYRLLIGDAPEISSLGLGRPDALAGLLVWLEIGLLALWAVNRRAAGALFLLVFLPLGAFNAERVGAALMEPARRPNAYDTAGQFAHATIPAAERDRVTIAGTHLGDLLRAKFHLDAADADIMDLPDGWALQPYQLPGSRDWLLVVGDHALPPGVVPVARQAGFALVHLNANNRTLGMAAMSGPLEGALLAGAEGLSGAEPWGRWSDAAQVRLHFKAPLPKRLNLFLTVQAYGPNAGKEFKLRAGDAATTFRIPAMPQEIFLQLETSGDERTIVIEVPEPVSPTSLGNSTDTRQLGIGIGKVEIGTPAR